MAVSTSARPSIVDRVRAACEMINGAYEDLTGTPYGVVTGTRGRGRPPGSTTQRTTETQPAETTGGAEAILTAITANPAMTRDQVLAKLGGNWNAGRLQLALNRFVKLGQVSETGEGNARTYTSTGAPAPATQPRRRAA